MNLDVREILEMVSSVLADLIRQRGPHVEVSSDYFWSIQDPRVLSSDLRPPEPTIGQLSETVEMLSKEVGPWEDVPSETIGTLLRWSSALLASLAAQLEREEV